MTVGRDDQPGRSWTLLTNHAQVLLCIADDPGIRLREIGERVGITERAAHRIVVDLTAARYITRERHGRRNHYTIKVDRPVNDEMARGRSDGQLRANVIDALRVVLIPDEELAGETPDGDVELDFLASGIPPIDEPAAS
jgi:hypothetical protein